MTEEDTQKFVQAFIRFIYKQMDNRRFPKDIVDSLEVAIQCLETVFELPTSNCFDELIKIQKFKVTDYKNEQCKKLPAPLSSVQSSQLAQNDVADIRNGGGDGVSDTTIDGAAGTTSIAVGTTDVIDRAVQTSPINDYDENDPLNKIDLFELFRSCGGFISEERKAEAEAIKTDGNCYMRDERYFDAIVAYSK